MYPPKAAGVTALISLHWCWVIHLAVCHPILKSNTILWHCHVFQTHFHFTTFRFKSVSPHNTHSSINCYIHSHTLHTSIICRIPIHSSPIQSLKHTSSLRSRQSIQLLLPLNQKSNTWPLHHPPHFNEFWHVNEYMLHTLPAQNLHRRLSMNPSNSGKCGMIHGLSSTKRLVQLQ